MKKWLSFLFVLLVAVLWSRARGSQVPAALRAQQPPNVCGATASQALVEPPNVESWKLPLNATGEHELILAVHRAGHRFCYRYTLQGRTETTAPTLRIRRGEHFALRIVNDITTQSKGEFVASSALPACMPMAMPNAPVTHYVGYLNHTIDDRYMAVAPVDTNIHLHGFEGPASEENVFLSTLSTPMHACEYHMRIPRTQPPGTYFYHPHVHGASYAEVAGGLSGVWIVEPDASPILRAADHTLVLHYQMPYRNDNAFAPDTDPIFNAGALHEGERKPAPPVAYDPFNPPPWPLSFPMKARGVSMPSNGCDGVAAESLISVDGSNAPASLAVPIGETELFRIVNATSDSPKELELQDSRGHLVPLHVVEKDGVPLSGDMRHPLGRFIAMNRLMIEPSGRAAILLTVKTGERLTLASGHFCSGVDGFYEMRHDLLFIRPLASIGRKARAIASTPMRIVDTPAAKLIAFARAHPALIHRRAITFSEYVFPQIGKIPERATYYITDTTNPNFHEHPFWPTYRPGATVPDNPDIVVKADSIEEWYLINTTEEAHIFHIHQMAFVDERSPEGIPLSVDDAFVPVGRLLPNPRDPNYPLVQPSITKVLLDFRHVPRGEFVFHCHMLFHEDHGMMGIIRVE